MGGGGLNVEQHSGWLVGVRVRVGVGLAIVVVGLRNLGVKLSHEAGARKGCDPVATSVVFCLPNLPFGLPLLWCLRRNCRSVAVNRNFTQSSAHQRP